MKQQFIEEKLESHQLTVFSSLEFRRATGLSSASAKQILLRYTKKGIILRLKNRRGLYCLKRNPPHPWLLANRFCRPSYISLETALSHHGAIPEAAHLVTSVTPLITRQFEALGLAFTYQKLKKEAYYGYEPKEVQGTTVLIAPREKALADFLYFVHLGRKAMNDRIRWDKINKNITLGHLKNFRRNGLLEWAKNVIP